MDMRADKIVAKPLYIQVHERLLFRIAEREWIPGNLLPNEAEIADELGVSIGTARRAFELLDEQGIIVRRKGVGTFLKKIDDIYGKYERIHYADGRRAQFDIKQCTVDRRDASAEEQRKLGMQVNNEIFCAKRLCEDEMGVPVKFEISITPSHAFPQDLDDDKLRLMTTIELANFCGLALGQMSETVKIVKPPRESARALGVKPSDRVMCLDRLLLRLDGAPLEWRVAWCAMREDLLYCASEGA